MILSLLVTVSPSPSPETAGATGLDAADSLAVIVAAVTVIVTVWYARKTVAARATIRVAKAARLADERDRLRQRLERIGDILIDLHLAAQGMGGDAAPADSWWRIPRERLERAMVGLPGLPGCFRVVRARTAVEALDCLHDAEREIEMRLRRLDEYGV
jgi:hypothetical protein